MDEDTAMDVSARPSGYPCIFQPGVESEVEHSGGGPESKEAATEPEAEQDKDLTELL